MNTKRKLPELINQYAEARHIQGHSTYNIKTAAARREVGDELERALSGVGETVAWALNAASSSTPPAEQQAAPKAAPGEQNESAYQRGYMDGMAKGRREVEAAPRQEAQEPVAWLNPWRADRVTTDYDAYGERGIPLYTAPQQEPSRDAKTWCSYVAGMIGCYLKKPDESAEVRAIAGIIERRLWALPAPQPAPVPLSDDVVRDAARYRWLRATTNYVTSNGERIDVRNMPETWDVAIDAAIAAQGCKDAE